MKKQEYPNYIITDIAPATLATTHLTQMNYSKLWLEAKIDAQNETYTLFAYGCNHGEITENPPLDCIATPWNENEIDSTGVSKIKLYGVNIIEDNLSFYDTLFVMNEFTIRRAEALERIPEEHYNIDDYLHPNPDNKAIHIKTIIKNDSTPFFNDVSEPILEKYGNMFKLGKIILEKIQETNQPTKNNKNLNPQ